MSTKSNNVVVNFDDLYDLLKDTTTQKEENIIDNSIKSTIFVVGKSPQVSVKQYPSAPDLYATLMLDGLRNPYVQLNFRIEKAGINNDKRGASSNNLLKFDIYRRKIHTKEQPVFDLSAVTQISKNILSFSKFSAERKAIPQVNISSLPVSYLNPNFYLEQTSLEAPTSTSKVVNRYVDSENNVLDMSFVKIGSVDYGSVLKELQNKQVFVVENDFINLFYNDRTPKFGETFEYYVVGAYRRIGGDTKSNILRVYITDTVDVRPPSSIVAKTFRTSLVLSVRIDDRDQVNRVLIFKKAEEDSEFKIIANINNLTNKVKIVDSDVLYGKKYKYRVFLRNIYGTYSDPSEITTTVSDQFLTSKTRSNDLRIPILSAIQDQNSDAIKITISPNDPRILYYKLQRKNLSIFERSFLVPSLDSDGYGALVGWEKDKFFVDKSLKEIEFVDKTVSIGNIYQYCTVGVDQFGNKSSFAFATVKNSGKKSVKTPINLKTEILRENPLRVKITWDDDNYGIDNIYFSVQRRRKDERVYKTFPLVKGKFIIDEFPVTDKIDFIPEDRPPSVSIEGSGGVGVSSATNPEGSGGVGSRDVVAITDRIPGTAPAVQDDTDARSPGGILDESIKRPEGIPEFLQTNTTYYYRVAAVQLVDSEYGKYSNYSSEIKFDTVPAISSPINLRAEVVNERVLPLSVRISWENDSNKLKPDHWVIKRKADTAYDTFEIMGESYLFSSYVDKTAKGGNSYVYKVGSSDIDGNIVGVKIIKVGV